MSRFFPHTPYAEDQPLYHTILSTHVLHRGFQTGAALGILYGGVAPVVSAIRAFSAAPLIAQWPVIQRTVGVGSAVGTGALAVALAMRMAGRSEIEWKDRSWRLMENQGQLAVDDWSLGGAVLALTYSFLTLTYSSLRKKNLKQLGWKTVLGRAGIGSTAGMVGYFVSKYLLVKRRTR
ncbi:hypothetical protein V8E54_010082 [Elaphomyces granulatus]|jgi:hypothetical protein